MCDGCPDAQPRLDDKGFSCKPLSSVNLLRDNTLQSDDPAMAVIVRGGWRNSLSLPVIEGLGIPVMHTWNQSVPLWEYHHGFQVSSRWIWITSEVCDLDGAKKLRPWCAVLRDCRGRGSPGCEC